MRWWPDRDFERCHIAPQQAARFQGDVWEEHIAAYLNGKDKVTVGEVARSGSDFRPHGSGLRIRTAYGRS
jgi:hypothetical protein